MLYPWVAVVFAFSCLAAFGGFIWAWLVHVLSARGRDDHSSEYLWRNFILRVAVIGAATVPVVNAQFLANPDWEGTLSQYITLATLSGAAAIALTPTFRVLALPPGLPANPFFSQVAAAPTVSGVNPDRGPAAGGITVTVTGSGFTSATEVNFGQVAALNLAVASDTQLTVTSPQAATTEGTVDVTVTTQAGTSSISPADQFTYTK